ncbi:MAG: type II and III secretion system protein [SAR86 cluster bacterium]|uniref:Type II and III secretion system protein n=1 Tax=SAR86 cluster bacterium TaxID=2030880 RepID=A0A2A5CAJ6_9GAMM|nr:MAG: type II and III secretion system protein [SAR86 cluster bacterium]
MLRKNKKILPEALNVDARNVALSSLTAVFLLLCSCTSNQLQPALPEIVESGRHLEAPTLPNPEAASTGNTDIPAVVSTLPLISLPEPVEEPDLYSVSVMNVPVRDLLFTIARDAAINIDIHPAITGQVSLNAIDQTILQILERLSQQIDIRWTFDQGNNVLVEPDSAFWRTYEVDYVNVTRTAETSTDIATSITSGGGGNNNSTANLTQTSNYDFWQSLTDNVAALLTDISADAANAETNNSVVSSPESGLLNVRATARQHSEVQTFINLVQRRSLAQVLIEVTVVEVSLSDSYQSGVDWNAVVSNSNLDISFDQLVTGANLNNSPTNVLNISGNDDTGESVSATIRLLSQFGDLKVLSSPRIMALNNQPAMLRVVDNRIYFTIDVTPAVIGVNGNITSQAIFTSSVETVPVGFVMTVTPQISNDDQVTLNVRPTISRIVRFVNDPNPELAASGVVNAIPEIQVREMESVMKVFSGDIAVLGGLMQDSLDNNNTGVPGLSRLPGIGGLFSLRDDTSTKTELIIFIRPVVIRQASLEGDLERYRQYLPENGLGINNS